MRPPAWTFEMAYGGKHTVEVEVHDSDPEQPDVRLFCAVSPWRRRALPPDQFPRLYRDALDRLPEEWRAEKAARRYQ